VIALLTECACYSSTKCTNQHTGVAKLIKERKFSIHS